MSSEIIRKPRGKVVSPRKHYEHLSAIPDLAGVRIIANYVADIPRICDIIRSAFYVVEEESGDKGDLLDANEFGYRSYHFVASHSSQRLELPEWKRFQGMRVEIQVRTILQHAWAAVSHALSYKRESDLPKEVRRRLNRLAGLFEIADEEFCSVRKSRDKIIASQLESIEHNNLAVEITPDTLAHYVDRSGADSRFQTIAEQVGWTIVPFCHESRHEDYQDLTGICDLVGITTLEEFKAFLDERETGELAPRVVSALDHASGGGWSVSPLFVLQVVLLVLRGKQVGLDDLKAKADWEEHAALTVLTLSRADVINRAVAPESPAVNTATKEQCRSRLSR